MCLGGDPAGGWLVGSSEDGLMDIVERLRGTLTTALEREAADEIERLRKELDFIHMELDKLRRIMDEP